MRNESNITAEQVRAMLDYNPDTGEFRWKPRTPEMFLKNVSAHICASWNAKYADKPAGYFRADKYRVISIDRNNFLAHRLAFLMTEGVWPQDLIDHINGDPSDNRLCNLRKASVSENGFNAKKYASNTSGYRGVYWCKIRNKWVSQICAYQKRRTLGQFDSKEAAYAAYLKAKAELHPFQPTPRGDRDEQAA